MNLTYMMTCTTFLGVIRHVFSELATHISHFNWLHLIVFYSLKMSSDADIQHSIVQKA